MTSDDFATEIAKQLPIKSVYKDAARPAARELGELGRDIVKTLRLALFPIQMTAALQDRYRRFVADAVGRVPDEHRVSPAPQLVGPVLEAVRYEPEGTPIDELFSNLLSSAMDDRKLNDAHPSFPSVVKALSPDEARILERIATGPRLSYVQRFTLSNGLSHTNSDTDDATKIDLVFPENIESYRDHLNRLGLIRFDATKPMQPLYAAGQQTGGLNFFAYALTPYGKSFMRACGKL